jgi:3-deoxy-7-phosphoheptulonate synthase
MIIVMQRNAEEQQIEQVVSKVKAAGLDVHLSRGKEVTIIGVIGDKTRLDPDELQAMSGVEKIMHVTASYKRASRDFHPENSVIQVGPMSFGGSRVSVIAGPCAVESREQLLETAQAVKAIGASALRGGAYKPRTNPYSFQGLQEKGLELLAEARAATGLPVVTELMSVKDIEVVAKYADVIQIGARNMQNFILLKEAGQAGKPILLKRGMSSTLEEFLLAAEYILAQGNNSVILCERGIRTFEDYNRNTLALAIVPVIKKVSHLPIIADPSHGTGRADLVIPMSRAAIAVGADGLIVEVHPHPEKALVDGPQSLSFPQFEELMKEIRPLAKVLGREIQGCPSK